jgi:hypothetical protein
VHFRRFVARAPESPWRARAEAHLHDLGGPSPRADEVAVMLWSGQQTSTDAYEKVVMAAAPRLQACLAEHPQAVLRADVFLPGKAGAAAAKPGPAKPAPPKGAGAKPVPPPPPAPTRPRAMPAPPQATERTFSVQIGVPWAVADTARTCVLNVLTGLKWPGPAAGPVRVQFSVSAP